MTDDTIRAALREAQMALCDRLTSGDCECRNSASMCACERRNCQPHDAAATITAFLRALHESLPDDAWIAAELAAAVEEAARHD